MYVQKIFVHCNSGIRHNVLDFFVLIDKHRIHGCEEHRMPLFFDTLPTRNRPRLNDRVWVVRASNMIVELLESIENVQVNWCSRCTGISSLFYARSLAMFELNQCEEDVILHRNIDARSSNFTAASSSRFAVSSCLNNLIIKFDTSRHVWSNVPGSTCIHFRSRYGIDTGDNVEFVCRGLAFVQDSLYSSLQCCPCESHPTSQSRTCWFHSRSWPKSKFCRQIGIRSWFQLRNVLDDNRPLHQELDRSSCSHKSTLSLEMTDHFEAKCALDMILSVCQVYHHRPSWSTVLFQQSSQDLHWSRFWSIEDELEDLRSSPRIHATSFPVLLHRSEKFDLLSTLLVALSWFPGCQALRVSPYPSNICKNCQVNSPHISATAP